MHAFYFSHNSSVLSVSLLCYLYALTTGGTQFLTVWLDSVNVKCTGEWCNVARQSRPRLCSNRKCNNVFRKKNQNPDLTLFDNCESVFKWISDVSKWTLRLAYLVRNDASSVNRKWLLSRWNNGGQRLWYSRNLRFCFCLCHYAVFASTLVSCQQGCCNERWPMQHTAFCTVAYLDFSASLCFSFLRLGIIAVCFIHACTATLPHPKVYLFHRNRWVFLCYVYNHTQTDAALHVLNVCAWGTSATFTEWKQTGSSTWIHRAMVALLPSIFKTVSGLVNTSSSLQHCKKKDNISASQNSSL